MLRIGRAQLEAAQNGVSRRREALTERARHAGVVARYDDDTAAEADQFEGYRAARWPRTHDGDVRRQCRESRILRGSGGGVL